MELKNVLSGSRLPPGCWLVLGILLSGCRHERNSQTHAKGNSSPPIEAVVGFDTSRSCRPQLGIFATAAGRFGARLDPDVDRLILYRVDQNTQEFSDRTAPRSAEEIHELLTAELGATPMHDGTYPARFWAEIGQRIAQIRKTHRKIIIIFFTDGDDDQGVRDSRSRISAIVQQLARNPDVLAVALYGVKRENRKYLRDCFASLEDRFQIYGPEEIDIAPLVSIVEQTHR